ncbi:hypothetical protein MCHIJ_14150 [Mycolicibacterium chitae]|nr:hypothetical protein MCHIJ_14150 [Mycolicibacterium chitae]
MTNPYLVGDFAPLHEEFTLTDLDVTGNVPDYLDGRYLRNGPNPIGEIDPELYHWFLGDGMVQYSLDSSTTAPPVAAIWRSSTPKPWAPSRASTCRTGCPPASTETGCPPRGEASATDEPPTMSESSTSTGVNDAADHARRNDGATDRSGAGRRVRTPGSALR